MKRIVLIDGENLMYGLRHLLGSETARVHRTALDNYDFRGLIDELLSDEPPKGIIWFGAKLRRYDNSSELLQKSSSAIASQAKFVNHLQKQKIQFIKVGYLRARESDACSKCGHQEWYLVEKGVDVGLAVRLVTESRKGVEIVVVSADTDLLSAIKAARVLNAKLMHIGYEHRPINSLSQATDATRLITVPLANKYKV